MNSAGTGTVLQYLHCIVYWCIQDQRLEETWLCCKLPGTSVCPHPLCTM